MTDGNIWFHQLELLINKKHMLTHPFYQAWTCGKLTHQQLQDYAKEYYHHVKAFPTYLSTLHSRCEDLTMRKIILQNLIDEEMGDPNHPDLWRRFGLALGITENDWEAHQPSHPTQCLIKTFQDSCSSSSLATGIAALYCYESQIPPICTTKIEGLKKWYGMTNPESYDYFSVHETADVEHSADEKELLIRLVKTEEDKKAVLKTAENVLDSLENFLSSFL